MGNKPSVCSRCSLVHGRVFCVVPHELFWTSFPFLSFLEASEGSYACMEPKVSPGTVCAVWAVVSDLGWLGSNSLGWFLEGPASGEVTGREVASPALVSSAACESVRVPFCCVRPGPVLRMCAPVAWLVQHRDLMLISSSPCEVRLAGSQDTLLLLRLRGDAIGTHLGWSACVYRKCLGNASPVTPNFTTLRVFCSGGLHFDNLSFQRKLFLSSSVF